MNIIVTDDKQIIDAEYSTLMDVNGDRVLLLKCYAYIKQRIIPSLDALHIVETMQMLDRDNERFQTYDVLLSGVIETIISCFHHNNMITIDISCLPPVLAKKYEEITKYRNTHSSHSNSTLIHFYGVQSSDGEISVRVSYGKTAYRYVSDLRDILDWVSNGITNQYNHFCNLVSDGIANGDVHLGEPLVFDLERWDAKHKLARNTDIKQKIKLNI